MKGATATNISLKFSIGGFLLIMIRSALIYI